MMMNGILSLAGHLGVMLAAFSDPWADRVIDASANLNGSGLYNDPSAALGEPTRTFVDRTSGEVFRSSVVVAAYNKDESGRKTMLTLNAGDFVTLAFDEPVEDDPQNPFGVDFLVFGNAFFLADRTVLPESSMEEVFLSGGAFTEEVVVAVSASGIGDPWSDPQEWHVYDTGPLADALFPTNAFTWDGCAHAWGGASNYARPVDPALTAEDFAGLSAADAIALYGGAGGGTGFDLAQSGFASIRFVYLAGTGGEVDALADVSPLRHYEGDVDRDGDVDLVDFARLQRCFSGGEGGIEGCNCLQADVDEDGDVDLDDHARLADEWSGPM